MEYISTRNTQKIFSFKDVFLKGLASDGGLFVPKKIPLYNSQELEKLRNLSYNELAAKIILKFCSDEFNETEIKDLVNASYKNFRVKDVVAIKKLGKINLISKGEIYWSAGPSGFVSEPIMVPSENSSKEDEGFLFILLWNGERRGSDLVILDAKDLKELAVYELPISIPHGLHGSWVN